MKRIIALLTVLFLALTAAGCAGEPGDSGSTAPSAEPSQTLQTPSDSASGEVSDTALSQEATELSFLIDKLYAVSTPPFPVQTREIDLTDTQSAQTFLGLTEFSDIKAAVTSESKIGSQAYSLVLVRLKDAADAGATAHAMLEGIDQRKWICVEADDLSVVAKDDLVMLVMMQSDFEEIKTRDIVEAFRTLNGGSLDISLDK